MTGATDTPGAPSGVLVIDKPLRSTSMHVCRVVRRKLVAGGAPKRVKVGHGGTLDPLATGVLVVLVGRATRLCELVMAGEKRYDAGIRLGSVSPTDDLEGPVVERHLLRAPTEEEVRAACAAMTGVILQRPPAYSAVKLGGRRAYEMARSGEAVVPEARPVEVHAIDVVSYVYPDLQVSVRCGKGTYIRSLARDLGDRLGTGGLLASLRRTRVGRWGLEDAVALDALPGVLRQPDLRPPIA